MSTSLGVLLSGTLPPPRAKPACTVQVNHRHPPGRNLEHQRFTVVTADGICMHGCWVHGIGANRRVEAVGFTFDTREAKERFRESVLRALDAGD